VKRKLLLFLVDETKRQILEIRFVEIISDETSDITPKSQLSSATGACTKEGFV